MSATQRERPFPVMGHMTVRQVRAYLETRRSILIPIGVIEQHGYHLPLNTDALIAERVAWLIGGRTGILVAPVMVESFSGGGCPGTVNISPAAMSLVVGDRLVSLVAQGFRNFYLFICHGGSENLRALQDALKMLLRNNPLFENAMLALLPVWEFSPGGWEKAVREGDWHAGWLETSMVMALAPDLVQMDRLEVDEEPVRSLMVEHPDNYQRAEKIVDDACVVPRMRQRAEVKVGVMGFPERASAELGRGIVKDIVDRASQKIEELEQRADGVYKPVTFTLPPLIYEDDAGKG